MTNERVFAMSFAGVYADYVAKVEKKGRSVEDLHEFITWLIGYTAKGFVCWNEKKSGLTRTIMNVMKVYGCSVENCGLITFHAFARRT